jgi:hypothetical protein
LDPGLTAPVAKAERTTLMLFGFPAHAVSDRLAACVGFLPPAYYITSQKNAALSLKIRTYTETKLLHPR